MIPTPPPTPSSTSPRNPRPPLGRSPGPARLSRIPWGWLEGYLIAQTFLPALLFVPGITPVRTPIRMASFLISIVAWAAILQSGRVRSGASTFPANFWLKLSAGWLLLLTLYWNTNSIGAGFAHAMLYISVFSPAFWAPSSLVAPRQIHRLMAILIVCNGLSTLVGIGQVFRPGTFNPPVVAALDVQTGGISKIDTVTYEDGHGRKILRPCGLTDQVGAASGAGATVALIGLAMAIRSIRLPWRVACLGLAFAGVAVIYYSQVRMIMFMLLISLMVLVVLFALQRHFGQATALGGLAFSMIVGAFLWVAATSGSSVVDRFTEMLTTKIAEKYDQSRGGFVREALTQTLWENPAGQGLGWWGQIYTAFGDKTIPTKIWVEVMIPAWVTDGGFPLLLGYGLAILFAMLDTLRVALKTKDRDLSYWAAVVFASNLSVLATCFSYVTFLTAIGIQFWLLAAVIHAADLRVRAGAPKVPTRGRRGPAQVAPPQPPPPWQKPSPYVSTKPAQP